VWPLWSEDLPKAVKCFALGSIHLTLSQVTANGFIGTDSVTAETDQMVHRRAPPLVTAVPRNCLLIAFLLLFPGGMPSFASEQLLISTLLSRSTSYQLHEVTLKGAVGQVVLHPPVFIEEGCINLY
jgi:hypothetical protein